MVVFVTSAILIPPPEPEVAYLFRRRIQMQYYRRFCPAYIRYIRLKFSELQFFSLVEIKLDLQTSFACDNQVEVLIQIVTI